MVHSVPKHSSIVLDYLRGWWPGEHLWERSRWVYKGILRAWNANLTVGNEACGSPGPWVLGPGGWASSAPASTRGLWSRPVLLTDLRSALPVSNPQSARNPICWDHIPILSPSPPNQRDWEMHLWLFVYEYKRASLTIKAPDCPKFAAFMVGEKASDSVNI